MQEFSSISVSSYEAGSLADRLTEQSESGWEVVAIVPTGSNVVAYLSRAAEASAPAAEAAESAEPAETIDEHAGEAAEEPTIGAEDAAAGAEEAAEPETTEEPEQDEAASSPPGSTTRMARRCRSR